MTSAPSTAVRSVSVPSQREGVLDGALGCIARWGLAKTTLDDVGRSAGVSRATVYRMFPGGKTALFTELAQREVLTSVSRVNQIILSSESLDDAVVAALTHVGRELSIDPAISYLLEHEPEVLLPFLSFDRLTPVLNVASALCSPALERFVDHSTAVSIVEWGARLAFSQQVHSSTFDLTDPAFVGRLWRMTVYSNSQSENNKGIPND